jgi:hypothetical protein
MVPQRIAAQSALVFAMVVASYFLPLDTIFDRNDTANVAVIVEESFDANIEQSSFVVEQEEEQERHAIKEERNNERNDVLEEQEEEEESNSIVVEKEEEEEEEEYNSIAEEQRNDEQLKRFVVVDNVMIEQSDARLAVDSNLRFGDRVRLVYARYHEPMSWMLLCFDALSIGWLFVAWFRRGSGSGNQAKRALADDDEARLRALDNERDAMLDVARQECAKMLREAEHEREQTLLHAKSLESEREAMLDGARQERAKLLSDVNEENAKLLAEERARMMDAVEAERARILRDADNERLRIVEAAETEAELLLVDRRESSELRATKSLPPPQLLINGVNAADVRSDDDNASLLADFDAERELEERAALQNRLDDMSKACSDRDAEIDKLNVQLLDVRSQIDDLKAERDEYKSAASANLGMPLGSGGKARRRRARSALAAHGSSYLLAHSGGGSSSSAEEEPNAASSSSSSPTSPLLRSLSDDDAIEADIDDDSDDSDPIVAMPTLVSSMPDLRRDGGGRRRSGSTPMPLARDNSFVLSAMRRIAPEQEEERELRRQRLVRKRFEEATNQPVFREILNFSTTLSKQ